MRKNWLKEVPQPFEVERTTEEGGRWERWGIALELDGAYKLMDEALADPDTVSARLMCALEYCFAPEVEAQVEAMRERTGLHLMDLTKKDIRH